MRTVFLSVKLQGSSLSTGSRSGMWNECRRLWDLWWRGCLRWGESTHKTWCHHPVKWIAHSQSFTLVIWLFFSSPLLGILGSLYSASLFSGGGKDRWDQSEGSASLFILNKGLFEFSQPFFTSGSFAYMYCFDFSVLIQGLMFITAKQVPVIRSQIELGICRGSFLA